MMAREQETLLAMGRIQMRETNYLQIVISDLHRTAGPYRSIWSSDADRPPLDGAPSCAAAPDIAAIDLFVAPTIGFDLLYVLVIVRLERRKLVWMNVCIRAE
jgi:hypothetical protein